MDDLDCPWYPGAGGSEAQNIVRQAEGAPDSPFRPRSRRRSDNLGSGVVAPPNPHPYSLHNSSQVPLSVAAVGPAAIAGTARGGGAVWRGIVLSVLLGKQPVAEALVSFLTLRDVFKTGSSCRLLMNKLVICGSAAPLAAANGNGSNGAANGGGGVEGGAGAGDDNAARP